MKWRLPGRVLKSLIQYRPIHSLERYLPNAQSFLLGACLFPVNAILQPNMMHSVQCLNNRYLRDPVQGLTQQTRLRCHLFSSNRFHSSSPTPIISSSSSGAQASSLSRNIRICGERLIGLNSNSESERTSSERSPSFA